MSAPRHVWLTGTLLFLLACLILLNDRARADPEVTPFRRWGVGWDQGIGLRYRLGPRWGLGFTVNPGFSSDTERSEGAWQRSNPEWEGEDQSGEEFRGKSLSVETLVLHETKLNRWLGVGPYVGLGYAHSESERNEARQRIETPAPNASVRIELATYDYRANSWELELGVRPTISWDDRFVLESRFGLRIRYIDETRDWVRWVFDLEQSYEEMSLDRDDSSRWELGSFGSGLGPGSVLTFMVYF